MAENWVKNALRGRCRRVQREVAWEERVEAPSDAPPPEAMVLRQEFWFRLFVVAQRLTSRQQELFIAYYLLHRSTQEVSQDSGRTPNAVRQALWTLRRRLRALLEEEGLDQTEARDYLQLLAPP